MNTETWKTIPGYEGIYQASTAGHVKRIGYGKGAKVGRVLKGNPTKNGYLFVNLYKYGQTVALYIHRIVAATFLGPVEDSVVNHKNKDRADNRLENLEITTYGENLSHARMDACPTCGKPFQETV